MFQNAYHVYHGIEIPENVNSTNKPTSNQPQDKPTTESTLDNMITFTSELYDLQLWTIAMSFSLNQMGSGDSFFACTSVEIIQGYD